MMAQFSNALAVIPRKTVHADAEYLFATVGHIFCQKGWRATNKLCFLNIADLWNVSHNSTVETS